MIIGPVAVLEVTLAEAVEEFLAELRCLEQSQKADLVSQVTAVKFLTARKFDVSRAIDLFQAYKNTRIKEGIYNINPNEEPLRSELLCGKFTVLPGRDANGAALALFTARLHRPHLTTHKAVLQAIIYQLDKAIESVQTQRDGLIFIYDMTNSTYANFDYELCVKILNLLKVCTVRAHELVNHIPFSSLPEHLGGSSQYSHIAWIQSCVNSSPNNPNNSPYVTGDCLGSLLHSYSMEHSQKTSADPLTANTLGATLLGDGLNSNCPILDDGNANLQNHRTAGHAHWNGSVLPGSGGISGSNANVVNGRGRQPPPQSETPPDTPLHQKLTAGATVPGGTIGMEGACLDERRQDGNGAEDVQQDVEFLEEEDDGGDGIPPLPLKSRPLPPLHHSPAPDMSWLPGTMTETATLSVHVAEPGGMSVQDLVQHVKCKKKKGIYQEYEEIRKEPPAGTFDYSKKASNQIKNRYSDVLCLDQSRVRLCPLNNEDDETSDYINASFMDGYKRSNAYIATQGPLPKTFGDFWRMVWEQMVLIIVMTTRVVERGRVKCGQYWPLEAGRTEDYGYFLVRNVHIEMFQDFKLSHLELFNTQTGECRELSHYLYMSWPDFGVPKSASAMLDFRAHVKQRQESSLRTLYPDWMGPPGGPPVVVHCSAGIGRTGTFCTLDICLSRLEDIGTVDIKQTVRRMRTQRAFSIQTWDQYYFCYKAVIEYAQQTGQLQPVEWSDTELETDSE
ncbi:tyrosine-protein phosphatase non-receptor type 9-like isoform X3 [Carassius auratus]|uniref:protein-tyrosine-phosphatase n=1 Tax=Carassius auratus TaxID=7957 RepID=A0A6P6PTP1_CARAU|nr:tyrosine-protein phosphatase non-receptor type 9-like isoform X3 [Carassius auratus]